MPSSVTPTETVLYQRAVSPTAAVRDRRDLTSLEAFSPESLARAPRTSNPCFVNAGPALRSCDQALGQSLETLRREIDRELTLGEIQPDDVRQGSGGCRQDEAHIVPGQQLVAVILVAQAPAWLICSSSRR